MEQVFLEYKSSRINYIRFGSGPKIAFCFHGYGENGASFSFLEKYLGSQFTFFSIDLPFHGNTEWKEGLICGSVDILQIMECILAENNPLHDKEIESLALLGYSLGGRVALSIYEAIPSRIEKMILLAPDGLKMNFWYWLATQTWIGNKLFSLTMKYPGWFFIMLKGLNKLKLVNASIFKFVNNYIGDETVRKLLYKRWTGLRKLKPNLEKVRTSILINKTRVHLVYGNHDRVILPARGEKFIKGMPATCTLSIIQSGHHVLQEKHAQAIVPALLH